ncbi:MAG: fibrillarin-like rRNA/tRNA 2'-O-methyltransferase [Candidatus Aenigmarchaeota archaeon]|nr:fibrillarin-like rRNA/tRNA 2'-O-methyltransferase [Candidatus Aenigmarchaeota archaeon]MDI6722458.1 fibrillarin-like rRNA/tRNA 2'-O-methyltransferase [Candidatus Aenigmarchaeota archaeon]
MKGVSEGVWKDGNRLYTKNARIGKKVYDEKLVKENGVEFREWNPSRSKLGAAIMNSMRNISFEKDSRILYLGASTGTTVSHVSDICDDGLIYAIEFSERVFRSLTDLCEQRKNIAPLLEDARKPENYSWIDECGVVFCDIAQPDETQIAIRNAEMFLKSEGILMIAIKSQSIDVTKKPEEVYEEETQKLVAAGYEVLEIIDLEPYEEKHAMIVARK